MPANKIYAFYYKKIEFNFVLNKDVLLNTKMHEKSWCRYYRSKLKECADPPYNRNNVVDLDFTPFVKDMQRHYGKHSVSVIDLEDCYGDDRSFYPFPFKKGEYINVYGWGYNTKTNNQFIFVNDPYSKIKIDMKYPLMLKKRLTYVKTHDYKAIYIDNVDHYDKSVYDRLDEIKPPPYDDPEWGSGMYM